MAGPLIATKLYVPSLRSGLVARPRLRERLELAAAAKLTLVSAPPGFGKTTLLAEWAREVAAGPGLVAWLSLDLADDDAGRFWSYAVAALEAVLPAVGPARVELASPGVPTGQVVTTLLNELAAAPAEVWLVLDDYHLVSSHEIRDSLQLLVEHLPPNAHVLVSTRADPDLPLSRWRARGELVEIRAADLRFTPAEVAEYLQAATGLALSPAEVDTLGRRTEGWIAALQLAALSLRGRDDAGGFVERFAGDDRYIVDYLMDEVLAHQPGEVRDFLLGTAVLDRLSGELCDAVTGLGNGARMLEVLERANLFVVALDDRLTWFRYHHLFADVLRARLSAERPGQVQPLHARASSWYQANGFTEDAIRHALAAGEVDRAGHLIELALPDARRDRRDSVLLSWLRALPDAAIRRSPVLTTFQAWTFLVAGDLAAMESRLDHADQLLAELPPGSPQPWPATEELRTLPATIAMYRASLAQARGDLAGVELHARRVLESAGPEDHFWRGAAAGFLALAAWSAGNIPVAVETFTAAIASLHSAGSLVDELNSTALLAEMWTVAGRPDKARDLCRRALAASEALGPGAARATADLHVALAELDLAAGDPGSAEQHLAAAGPLAEREPNSESRYRRFVAAAGLAGARGDHERALRLLADADEHYRPGYYPDLRPIAAIRARVWIAAGDLARAADWAAEAGVAATDEVSYPREYEHLTLARLLLADRRPGNLEAAARLLARLEEAAATSGREGSLVDIRRLLALARDPGAGVPPARTPGGLPAADALTERELQVLRLLDSELSGPEIARRLFVSHNTLRTHTKHIFTKLEVTTRRAAVRRAREVGLM